MKQSIRFIAVAALVAISALALPTAAQARTIIYPPSNACNVVPSPVITPGATVTFSCTDGTFSPSEFVTVTVEGNTGADVGFITTAVTSSANTVSTSTGALEGVEISFPSDANGVYNIAAVSATSAGGVSSVSVGSTTGADAGGSLPATGFDSNALLGLWVGGGALVLAGGAVAVTAAVRRNRREHAGI